MKALLADQLAIRNVHALQTRAVGIQCLKALNAEHGVGNHLVLQALPQHLVVVLGIGLPA
jgi:hypothetical protein